MPEAYPYEALYEAPLNLTASVVVPDLNVGS